MAGIGLARVTDTLAQWPEHPLRALPRLAAMGLLALFLGLSVWNISSLGHREVAQQRDIAHRKAHHESLDKDLYHAINMRVAKGENYYHAALAEQRARHYPTTPFVTVRTPIVAWVSALVGEQGWRLIAAILWGANLLVWLAILKPPLRWWERFGGAALVGYGGIIAFAHTVVFSHETLAGLFLGLALALSRSRVWPIGLILAVVAVAIRELALPFLLLWAVLAVVEGRKREALAVTGGIVLIAIGLAFHAAAVAAARMPGDLVSPPWTGLMGLSLPFYGISETTLLVMLKSWAAGPLCVLPLLGWWGLGGRFGLFASLWYTGFIAFVAIFARQENFYWMAMLVPAYLAGLAFLPRALVDFVSAIRRTPAMATN
ncbi:MAG: hypothetical protein ABGW87_08530 [Sphingomonadaceae bacterium]